MKIARYIKESLCTVLSVLILFAFSACTEANDVSTNTESFSTETNDVFTKTESLNVVDASGTEYEFIAVESSLYYLGELVFQGSVEGE